MLIDLEKFDIITFDYENINLVIFVIGMSGFFGLLLSILHIALGISSTNPEKPARLPRNMIFIYSGLVAILLLLDIFIFRPTHYSF